MSKKLLFISSLAIACIVIAAYFFVVKKPFNASKGAGTRSAETQTSPFESAVAPKPSSIPAPPDDRAAKQAVEDIRSELQSVMLLNEAINKERSSKSAQLSLIQEQAQSHQEILSKIELLIGGREKEIPKRETLLEQEKLRVIREEALRSKKELERTEMSSKSPQ